MSYRDDLIRRLQDQGLWQSMPPSVQTRFQELSDEQARQIMVLEDQWTLSEPDAVNVVGLVSIVRLIHSFKGALIAHGGENAGKLAKPGRLLAEFVIELSNHGLTSDDIDEGLSQMSPMAIAALIAAYQSTS